MDRFDELQIFIAILDTSSLSGAARRLRRSAPAVTRALAALEARAGVRLIERTTRRLAPTEAGIRLGEMARRVLAEYSDALSEPDGGALSGSLRLTAPHVFGRRHVTPAIIAFLEQHPQLNVEIVFDNLNLDLIEHGLDLAVRIGPLPDTGMVARRVGEVRRVVVASPAYVAQHGVPATPRELEAHHIIFNSGVSRSTEWRFKGEGRDSIARVTPRLTVNDIDTVLMAVIAGHGMGRMLSYQVADQLRSGALLRLLPDYEPEPLPVQLVVQSARYMTPRLRACFDYLAEQLSGLTVLQPMVQPLLREAL